MKFKHILFITTLSFSLLSCTGGNNTSSQSQSEPQTAPAIQVEVQARYTTNGVYDPNIFINTQDDFFKLGLAISRGNVSSNTQPQITSNVDSIPAWSSTTVYSNPGNKVIFTKSNKTGVFANSWWTTAEEPSFVPNYASPWRLIQSVNSESDPRVIYTIPQWSDNGQYTAGYTVKYAEYDKCYKAKWWNQGAKPPQNTPVNSWETPWTIISCPETLEENESVDNKNREGEIDEIDDLPPQGESSVPIESLPAPPENTPLVPVVEPAPSPSPIASPTPIVAESQLPSTGYQVLRKINETDWQWFFPLSYGKLNQQGDLYNNPPFTDDPGDIFTLSNFKRAVLEYNAYAKRNNYKQFLNDGNTKQQAEEFAAFMSNVSRETSGSWSGAPSPWITDYLINGVVTKVWKGGLYWVQEVSYSTNPDGTSASVGYVDTTSEWKPVQGRSYHGRGPIQLSWNYNYGYFSAWLYDNGLYPEKIKSRDALLQNPGLVNSDPVVSMLSAIWFWMTPQGVKPSAHDVMYGAVSNISKSSFDDHPGLPPMNNGRIPAVASGDSNNVDVVAYRLGTTINIINGGIECNGQASWHPGPPQRAAYYDAYAAYLNAQYDFGAKIIPSAINIWDNKISSNDDLAKQSATCFNQKSYYGW